jgi:hypothetical protein
MTGNSTLTIRTLLCHRDVDMALICLGSLLRFSVEPINLIVHDDGSLTPEDIEKLLNGLKGATILLRSEADALMSEILKNYPNCRNFRDDTAIALKLFDTILLSDDDVAYCDTDILFLRPFTEMFKFPDRNTSAIFMQDCRESYSVRPWQLLGTQGLKIPSRVNAGLMFIRKASYDLDFIEWFVGQKEYWTTPSHRLEQTCWAALGYRIGCRLWNSQQVVLVTSSKDITDAAVAGHFVSRYRSYLQEFILKAEATPANQVSALVETIPAKDCDLMNLSISLLRHRLGGIKYTILKSTVPGYKAAWE